MYLLSNSSKDSQSFSSLPKTDTMWNKYQEILVKNNRGASRKQEDLCAETFGTFHDKLKNQKNNKTIPSFSKNIYTYNTFGIKSE
jgi:hypothetical protein